jgi:hypothetical protein
MLARIASAIENADRQLLGFCVPADESDDCELIEVHVLFLPSSRFLWAHRSELATRFLTIQAPLNPTRIVWRNEGQVHVHVEASLFGQTMGHEGIGSVER